MPLQNLEICMQPYARNEGLSAMHTDKNIIPPLLPKRGEFSGLTLFVFAVAALLTPSLDLLWSESMFILLALYVWLMRISSRYSFAVSLTLLILIPVFDLLGRQIFAESLAIYAFYALSIGVGGAAIEAHSKSKVEYHAEKTSMRGNVQIKATNTKELSLIGACKDLIEQSVSRARSHLMNRRYLKNLQDVTTLQFVLYVAAPTAAIIVVATNAATTDKIMYVFGLALLAASTKPKYTALLSLVAFLAGFASYIVLDDLQIAQQSLNYALFYFMITAISFAANGNLVRKYNKLKKIYSHVYFNHLSMGSNNFFPYDKVSFAFYFLAVILAVFLIVYMPPATYSIPGAYAVFAFAFRIRSQYSFAIAISLLIAASIAHLEGSDSIAQQLGAYGALAFSTATLSLLMDEEKRPPHPEEYRWQARSGKTAAKQKLVAIKNRMKRAERAIKYPYPPTITNEASAIYKNS